ncbi:MAG: DUF481 domain-containing protein [Holophagaceae bacterium]
MRFARFQLVLAGLALGVQAQEAPAPKRPWSDKAALSFVAVGGNASSQSLGFSNEFKYAWAEAAFSFNIGGVRVATAAADRSASGPDLAKATILETRTTKTSTETYYANLRYDHTLTEGLQWFGVASWERNIPAGLEARYRGWRAWATGGPRQTGRSSPPTPAWATPRRTWCSCPWGRKTASPPSGWA